jgi:predicted phage terminase large subunit-like protein
MSYPLWSILGEQEKKFVLILSQTQRQSRQHLINLKHELENNKLLQTDLGPFKEETDEWGSLSLVIPKYNARITAASTEQSVRGLRHLEHRPDLIICDDIEDLESVKTKEGRDKTHQWLTGDVIPSGDNETRVIVVGNLLHEDSVLMRLKKGIVDEKKLDGVFRYYPLVDELGTIAWPGKYPNMESVEALKRTIGNDSAWYREYLLRIISDSERVVHPEWIHHYDVLPKSRDRFHYAATGIDLAISQRTTADFTAMVSGFFYMGDKERKIIYILPNPVNARLTFPEALDKAKWVSKTIDPGHTSKLFVEEVAYQKAFTQQLAEDGFHVEGAKVGNQDKRSRLALTTNMIKNGQILFPEKGCEQLIAQLTGFGVEKHDDLVDAFTILVLKITEENITVPEVFCISMGSRLGRRGLSDNNYWSRYM